MRRKVVDDGRAEHRGPADCGFGSVPSEHHAERRPPRRGAGAIQRLDDNVGNRGQLRDSQVGRFLLMAFV